MSDIEKCPLVLVVETFDCLTEKVIDRKRIDHNNSESRQWLGKHCFWAFRNGRGVRTYPLLQPALNNSD